MANDPDVSVKDVARVVAGDPVLAMTVLRMANSAMSAPVSPITDITEAVGRLGTASVRNVVLAACLQAQAADQKVYGKAGARIVDHSLGTALIALRLGPRKQAGELFLGGLLHDVGKLLILKIAHDTRSAFPDLTDGEVETIVAERHAQMGGWLAARWQLPEALSELIAWHHHPDWAERYEMVSTIRIASRLAYRYGFGGEARTDDLLEDPACEAVGLDADRLAELDGDAPDLFATARSIFGRRA